MNNIELEDIAILTAIIFVLFSLAIFWKLYFFHPPTKSNAEFELQHKSHAISNESTKLQSTLRNIDLNVDALRKLVEGMQHRRASNHHD